MIGVEVSRMLWQLGQTALKVCAKPRISTGPPQFGQLSPLAFATRCPAMPGFICHAEQAGYKSAAGCNPALHFSYEPAFKLAQGLEVRLGKFDRAAEEQKRRVLGIVDGGELAAGTAQVGEQHFMFVPEFKGQLALHGPVIRV